MANSKKIYGLIGKKLNHSFSSAYFANKFEKEAIKDVEYINFPLANIADIKELLEENPNIKGLNVTVPYKQEIIPFLDELSADAKVIGAVNTIEFKDGKLIGHNTDVIGFEQSLKPLLNSRHQKAVIFGIGGASKAVAFVMKKLKIPTRVISRDKTKQTYKDVNKAFLRERQILINTTPLGTFPNVNECVDIYYHGITAYHLAYDLVYNPEESLFLQKAKKQGAVIKNGQQMLELQAEASWKIWNGLNG